MIPEQIQLSALALPSSIAVVLATLVPKLLNSRGSASELDRVACLNVFCFYSCPFTLGAIVH